MLTAIASPHRPCGLRDRATRWIQRWIADHRKPSWDEQLADTLDAELARWRAVAR